MPVTTRGQAKRFQEEFAVAKIQVAHGEYSYSITGVSATGQGVHIRWVYCDEPHPDVRNMDVIPQNTKSLDVQRTEPNSVQGEKPWSVGSASEPDDGKCGTLESSIPMPPPFKQSSSTRVTADTDMRFFVHIKKDEVVEEAVRRHIELYTKESQIRQRENQRRVYEFVKTRPQLLSDVK